MGQPACQRLHSLLHRVPLEAVGGGDLGLAGGVGAVVCCLTAQALYVVVEDEKVSDCATFQVAFLLVASQGVCNGGALTVIFLVVASAGAAASVEAGFTVVVCLVDALVV